MPDTDTVTYASPAAVGSLADLFEALKLELGAMIGGDEDLTGLFDAGFVEAATAAYGDGVGVAVDELIDVARSVEENSDRRLAFHGLTGEPFQMKVRAVQRRMDERNGILERISSGQYGKAPSLLGTAQKKLLEAIDVILDSFVEGMGIGGIVKEYKKVFEQAL